MIANCALLKYQHHTSTTNHTRTSNPIKHLKTKHEKECDEIATSSTPQQPTVQQTHGCGEKMSNDNAGNIREALTQNIVLDNRA